MNKRLFSSLFLHIGFFALFIAISAHTFAGKLAIVIDDIGYRNKEDKAIYALPKEVNVAIIPSAPYATERANRAFEQQRDVLIHLPMQPQNSQQSIEAGALLVGMNENKVAEIVAKARNQVPYAIGVNNHMGSRATADRPLMTHLMKELAKNHLFFLDSKTAGNSLAFKIAKEEGVAALERHIFLDDSDEISAVQKQFNAAVSYARKKGTAILIGHPRKNSISVLEKGLANLPNDIQLVSISQLWRGQPVKPTKPFIMVFEVEPAPTSVAPYHSVPMLRGIPKE